MKSDDGKRDALTVFQSNVEFVNELLDFDHFILDFVIEPLQGYATTARSHNIFIRSHRR